MHNLTSLVLGGARSGKSSFGEKLAINSGLELYYLATAEARDEEMQNRIMRHKKDRSEHKWYTIEEPNALASTIQQYSIPERIILVDCLTLWLNNIVQADLNVSLEVEKLLKAINSATGPIIFISNEVGMGIVPMNKLARDFRDHEGRLNQQVAAFVPNCYFILAGLPLPLKTNNRTLLESLPQ